MSGDDVLRCYLPYDFPFAAKRFLAYFNPAFGVLLETEIWPNLIRVSRQRGVPIFLIAARLSEKSFRNYFRFRSFAAEVLNNLAGIGAQSAADAGRLKALGGTAVNVTGSLKFDIAPPLEQLAQGHQWKREWGSRPILLCASTREGEEAPLLDALANVNVETVLIVIVPRHPQRFDEVARLIEGHGLNYQRRSANQPIAEHTRVLLGDTMGEMFAYYAACDVAIIGGSLLPFGAQNLIEACAVGRPVIVGPHTYNFAEATALAIDAGAAIKVDDVSGAVSAARELLVDRVRAEEMGHRGLEFARAHRGATERSLALIKHGIASAADARDTRRKRA
jgi:3-deoxy-D-manno-octulosonic-acid transferase